MPCPSVAASSRPSPVKLHLERLEDRISPALLGETLFPDNSPYNQVITSAPVAPNSAAIIQYIESQYTTGEHGTPLVDGTADDDLSDPNETPSEGIPYNVVHGNSPNVQYLTVQLGQAAYLSQSAVGPNVTSITVPYTGVLQMETGGDHHLIIYDLDNELDYEFYGAEAPAMNGTNSWTAQYVGIWNAQTNSYNTLGFTSADAAGLPILPLLLRPDEALPVSQGGQGVIDHALRYTLPSGYIQNNTVMYPASHLTVGGFDNALPYIGMRLRLNPNLTFPNLTGDAAVVVKALQTYGMILADRGGDNITAAPDSVDGNNNKVSTWEDADGTLGMTELVFAFGQVIPMSDFQVVNLTPVVSSVSPSTVYAGSYVTIRGTNFGGAAGRISVLFGGLPSNGIPSPNVTVVNNTTIIAEVPPLPVSLTATTYVYVQSGITETDANTTYDAVGRSISNATHLSNLWGYGTSLASAIVLYAESASTYINSPVAVVDPSGVEHLFFQEAGGGIVEWDQTGSTWSQVPVTGALSTLPAVSSDLEATLEDDHGTPALHLVYVDKHGQLDDVWRLLTQSTWQVTDLSSFLPTGAVALGNPSVFEANGTEQVVTRVRYQFTSAVTSGQQSIVDIASNGDGTITSQDLLGLFPGTGSPAVGQPQTGNPPPRAPYVASDPVGYAYTTTSNGQTSTELVFVYRDDFGAIETIWQDASGNWQTAQLSAVQGLNNTASGTPDAFVSAGTQYIVYRNQDGQVQELTLAAGAANWQLAALPAGLPTAESSPQGFDVNGAPQVLYLAQNGRLVEVANGAWSYLTSATGTRAVLPADNPRALVLSDAGEAIIFTDSISHHLYEANEASGAWTLALLKAQAHTGGPERQAVSQAETQASESATVAALASLFMGDDQDVIGRLLHGSAGGRPS